ncbi:unnamed protein product, partial [Rotaria sp. Silwood2]
ATAITGSIAATIDAVAATCPIGQASAITTKYNQRINYNTQFSNCPSCANVTVEDNSEIYDVCSTQELNIAANGNGKISMKLSSACPKLINIIATKNAEVCNICVSDQLTVLSATGNSNISMTCNQISSCPKIVNILDGSDISVFYVCATQAINAKLRDIATLYYKGPLNHIEVTDGASIKQWS